MSEHSATGTIARDSSPDEYTWRHVAEDMPDWHPDLQVHAQRLLESHGVQSGSAAEKPPMSSQEIREAFKASQQELYTLGTEAAFQAKCVEQGIDPYDDMDKPEYWNVFADYAHEVAATRRKEQGDSARLRTLELLSATPAFLFEHHALKHDTHQSVRERHHGREVVSYFNGLIRDFAADFPETRAPDLTASLLGVANVAIEDKAMQHQAAQDIRQRVRGAQHEMAFGQLLAKTGHAFRPARLEEDLKGIDYVIDEHTVSPVYVDVKASLSEIEARGSGGAFARKPDGKVVMYSLVQDKELDGRFYLDDATANTKAQALNQLLTQATLRSA